MTTSRRGFLAGSLAGVAASAGWLASAKAHEFLDVIGPLGKPFAYPRPVALMPPAAPTVRLLRQIRTLPPFVGSE